jgi:EmrB/QacA subfamily drug resistance transporter
MDETRSQGRLAAMGFDRATIRVVVAVMTGGMAVLLDTTIVAVALKTLAVDFGASVTTIQWVTTAYLLAVGVSMPLAAWAQGRWGGKRLWLAGLVLFGLGSIGASMAGTIGVLVAARAVQGVGGGVLMPLMATLPLQSARGKITGRAIALVSLPMIVGPMLGPVLGGVILQYLSWRWMFWVNVPLVLVGLWLAVRALPDDDGTTARPLDLVGTLLLPPGLVGVLYGLSKVSGAGGFGHTEVLVPLGIGAALVAGFVVHATLRGAGALVDLRLMRRRQVGSASAVMFLTGAGLFAGMMLLPLFWQLGRGKDVLVAGLLLVPQGVGSLLARPVAGALTDRVGPRLVTAGGVLVAIAGTVPFALADASTSSWWLGAALVVRGFGMGALFIPVMAVAYNGLVGDDVAHASILARVSQQIGGSFGTAVLAVVLERALETGTPAAAFDRAFWWTVAMSAATLLAVPFLPGGLAMLGGPEPAAIDEADEADEADDEPVPEPVGS